MADKVQKLKPQEFVNTLGKFLADDETHNVLIRGYFDMPKLKPSLRVIKNTKEMHKGVIVEGGMNKNKLESMLGRALNIPNFYLDSLEWLNIGNGTNIVSTKWNQSVHFTYGDDCDFAFFFPIQEEVVEPKYTEILVEKLKNSRAKKNILLTSNDWTKNPEVLYKYMDKIVSLDLEDYSNKYKEELKNIKTNIDDKPLPY